MVLEIGKNDRFERLYMAKFRAMAAEFGEFAEYGRDRAGRDIGLHFVTQKRSGGELVEPSLVWFQMKGVQSTTFSKEQFQDAKSLSISLDVGHLRFWYIAPEPTYLALYIESVGEFFVLDLQKHIRENHGDEILTMDQKTLTIHVSKDSILDAQAFRLIKHRRSVSAWQSRIAQGEEFAGVFFRDAEMIQRIASSNERKVTVKFILRKYGSKARSEAHFIEVPLDGSHDPKVVREHWQFMMPDDLGSVFPYLDFNPDEGAEFDEETFWDDEEHWEWPPLELPNGKHVLPEGVFELVEYKMLVTLNDVGRAWAQTLSVMESAGFIEIDNKTPSLVSVAPWHVRDV